MIKANGQLLADDIEAFDKQFVLVQHVDGKNVLKTGAQWVKE